MLSISSQVHWGGGVIHLHHFWVKTGVPWAALMPPECMVVVQCSNAQTKINKTKAKLKERLAKR